MTAVLLQALLGQRGTVAAPTVDTEVFYTSETDAQPLASGAPLWCQAFVNPTVMDAQSEPPRLSCLRTL